METGSVYLRFHTGEYSCVLRSGAQMCSQDVSERTLGTFLSSGNVFSDEKRSDKKGAADTSPFCMKRKRLNC